MNYPDTYTVGFHGLKPGTHQFEFNVGTTFFEQAEDQEIQGGNVSVQVIMIKEERMMDLHFTFTGEVVVACDRCMDPLTIGLNGEERLIVKLGDRYEEESDEVQIVPESAHHLDLAPFLYEYIHLLLPARKVHAEDENGAILCNPEVIRKLNEMEGHHTPDPRWEALNKLKEN